MPLAAMAGLGVGQALVGGIFGSKAANAQVNAQRQALALQQQIYNQNRADALPWMTNGQNASNNLSWLLGLGDPNRAASGTGAFGSLVKPFGVDDFQKDPGYQFRLSEGLKAIDRSAAARGASFSGGTLKALDQYNQGFASNEYSNAFNRNMQNKQSTYGMLSGVSGQGLQAQGNIAQSGMNYANQGANIYGNIGAAQAMGDASWANSINQGLSTFGQGYMLSKLLGRPAPPSNMTGYGTPIGSPGYTGGGGIGSNMTGPGGANWWQATWPTNYPGQYGGG